MTRKIAIAAALLAVLLAYSNHFGNSFHFDDSHTIIDNPWIRDTANIPRFFTDGTTFSALPPNRSYRPLVSASLAIDYHLAHGLKPVWFHVSTFVWFLVQLTLMFLLFRRITGEWSALFATALYGLHPVMAETVNYIIQRGDIYSTLGVVAGLALYVLRPSLRRYGVYLLPVIAGVLSKPPAAVFPALLFLHILWFEEAPITAALRSTVPAMVAIGAAAVFTALMNPPSFVAGAGSQFAYRISQPAVLATYFRKFFLPFGLSADTDRRPYESAFDPAALGGLLFVICLCAVIWFASKRREYRPVAFGLAWFLIASLPTSLIALAEVENDHRMYFPFVGLALAVASAMAQVVQRRAVRPLFAAAAAVLLLTAFAWGTRERNQVWKTDETLWRDVIQKSPKNGRGLMNYGLTQMAKGNYAGAIDSFRAASALTPDYYVLEINLGIVYGATNRPAEAEKHFLRAIQLAPLEATPRYYYARWLSEVYRAHDAVAQLIPAVQQNPDHVASRYLLMQIYQGLGEAQKLRSLAEETLARFPDDAAAKTFLTASLVPSPAAYLNQSMTLYSQGKYHECIVAAQQALKLKPDFPEAWNNIAAAYNSMSMWDEGIAAADKAIGLNPNFQLAKNNRAWALSQKKK